MRTWVDATVVAITLFGAPLLFLWWRRNRAMYRKELPSGRGVGVHCVGRPIIVLNKISGTASLF